MSETIEDLLRDVGELPVVVEGGLRELKNRLRLASQILESLPDAVRVKPLLVVVGSPLKHIELEGAMVLGRDQVDNGDQGFSRRQFTITRKKGQSWIEDCGSKNGTWINGSRLSEPRSLCDGDLVHASTTLLLFLQP